MIPSGVTTVLVSALPQTTVPVVPSSVAIEVTASMNLEWAATGQLLSTMLNISPNPGWIQLPAVDQLGFITVDTRISITGWSYAVTVTWSETDGTTHSAAGAVQCFSNQEVTYLADVDGALGPTYPGTVISLQVMPYAQYAGLNTPNPNTLYFTY